MGSLSELPELETCDACLRPAEDLAKVIVGRLCESCRAVIQVAEVLADEEITDETRIVPTFAFAACATEIPALARIRDEFLTVGRGSKAEKELRLDFHSNFGPLEAEGDVGGVLVVKQAPLFARVHRLKGTDDRIEKITIDIYSDSVKARDVRDHYEKALRVAGVSWDEWGRGLIGPEHYPHCLRVGVWPDNLRRTIFDGPIGPARCPKNQLLFPTPGQVGINFEVQKRLFGGDLVGRRGGVEHGHKRLIQTCVYFYIRGRDRLIEQPQLPRTATDGEVRDRVVRVLDYISCFLGTDKLDRRSSPEAKRVWQHFRQTSPRLESVDDELRDRCSRLVALQ